MTTVMIAPNVQRRYACDMTWLSAQYALYLGYPTKGCNTRGEGSGGWSKPDVESTKIMSSERSQGVLADGKHCNCQVKPNKTQNVKTQRTGLGIKFEYLRTFKPIVLQS